MSDGNDTDRTDRHAEISRRRALAAAGALGLTGTIAGCLGGNGGSGGDTDTPTSSGGDGGDTDTPTTSSGGGGDTATPTTSSGGGGGDTSTSGGGTSDTGGTGGTVTGSAVESMYKIPGGSEGVPNELQYNFYNDQQTVPKVFTWDRLAVTTFGMDDGLFYPELAKDWSYDTDEQTFTINLREDTTWWHNDEQVTSQDVWAVLMLEWHDREVLTGQSESVETPDDKTVVLNLTGETNQTLLEQQVLTRSVLPYSHYGEWAEDVKGLLGEDDQEEWSQYLTDNVVTATFDEKIGNGPFKITEATRQAFQSEVHEGHWAMDPWAKTGVEGARLEWGSNQRIQQAAFSDKMDAIGGGNQKSFRQRLPDHFRQVQKPKTNGIGVGLNHNIAPLGKPKVRQALMHIINREDASKAAASSSSGKIVPEAITGISASIDTYIPEGDVRSQYQTYPVDTEKATTLLEEAGLSKKGGTWRLEDGSKWSPLITVMANNTGTIQAMNTVASQLSQFGIKTELETVPNSQYFGELWTENDFTMYAMYWGGWRPYPLNGLSASLYSHRHDNIGYPALRKNGGEIEVPMPIGKPNGDTKTIDVEALINELTSSADQQRNTEIFQKLGWVYNQTLPELPLYYGTGSTMLGTHGWNVPKQDSPGGKMKAPEQHGPKCGLTTPKTK